MDTRFWGPSGWRLLHCITFAYDPANTKTRSAIKMAFEMLPFVLPCKFCRASLTEYMEIHPLDPAMESKATLTKWLWTVHNEVNKKLRNQKLHVAPDPPFEKVSEFYENLLSQGCSQTEFPGWDFLFSVAEMHPMSLRAKGSVEIPPAGKDFTCESVKGRDDRNRWNCMKPGERLELYMKFWKAIGKALPFPEWRRSWAKHSVNPVLETRAGTLKWLWRIRCKMERDLKLLNRCKYASLCKTLKTYRSGCAKSSKARTCRKQR